ncbi:transcriptional regulator FeaR [Enterobacteriaceae bacterium 4M9]|nr:transcriptional regulator FeaR [Enterobacteriaceae bacterium 4M9]
MVGQEYRQFDAWLARVNSACGRFSGQPLEGRFRGQLDEFCAGSMKLSTVEIGNAQMQRGRRELAVSRDDWFYTVFQLEGKAQLEQEDARIELCPGDITLIDAARPSALYWHGHSRQISLLLPRHLLDAPGVSIPCARRLDGSAPVVRLSHQLLHESMKGKALTMDESEAALNALVCLLRPVLTGRHAPASRREQLFSKVTRMIDDSLACDDLRPEWLASEAGMSVRSLYRLFADKGLVVAQYIRNRRLDRCALALRGESSDEKLASVGYSWGFTDHSHFSTAFRQRFGMTPGEYRRRHR